MDVPGGLDFAPDAARARALDARMRERLADSLHHVVEQIGDALPLPAALPELFARLAAGPVDPQAFGAYYELVLALEEDDLDGATRFLRDLVDANARAPSWSVWPLGDPDTCARSRRYARLVDTDPSWPLRIAAPEPAAVERTRSRIDRAMALLDRGHPELAAEMRALLGEIVLARPASLTQGQSFDGVSSFMLWGGLVLHADSHETPLEMAEALAHECAHCLLFGFAVDGPLLEDEDLERYASPLRTDPRPLDGIYHATFVTARMHHALSRLRDAGVLDRDERAWVEGRLETHVKHFEEGWAVLERHARPTPVGAAALANARTALRAG